MKIGLDTILYQWLCLAQQVRRGEALADVDHPLAIEVFGIEKGSLKKLFRGKVDE